MVKVLATVVLSMLVLVGPLGTVGAESAELQDGTMWTCNTDNNACHCPTDVHNYIWRMYDYIEECLE